MYTPLHVTLVATTLIRFFGLLLKNITFKKIRCTITQYTNISLNWILCGYLSNCGWKMLQKYKTRFSFSSTNLGQRFKKIAVSSQYTSSTFKIHQKTNFDPPCTAINYNCNNDGTRFILQFYKLYKIIQQPI